MKRLLVLAFVFVVIAWLAVGLHTRARRAARAEPAWGEVRGAWHVHTNASDGREPLEDVVRAARDAGLQFVVITEHNEQLPAAPEYRDGVLVVPATEISSPVGHVVGVGLPRALTEQERKGDPFAAISALGGRAVVAHPFHPRRPFRGDWRDRRIAGLETVSNDSMWGFTLARMRAGALIEGVAALPWDAAQGVLALYDRPADELRAYDALSRDRRLAFLCSVDAHGLPSYRAAFQAFSMHVVTAPPLSGNARADAKRVASALLDGEASCVFDGVAPAAGVRIRRAGRALTFGVMARPDRGHAEVSVVHDGVARPAIAVADPASGRVEWALCDGECSPGTYRVEARIGPRPWIFTHSVRID